MDDTQHLKPCPFCGKIGTDGATTLVEPQGRMWLGSRYSDPASWVVRHWCPKPEGQPTRILERAGRDMGSAVAAWNQRAGGVK